MNQLEKRCIIKRLLLIHLRFIDDTFFIWTGSIKDLTKFLNELNTKHPTIKFKFDKYKRKVMFLDTETYIKDNKLYTKIYKKESATQTFLNITSEHLISIKNNIPYNQALRIKRICSTYSVLSSPALLMILSKKFEALNFYN